MGRIFSIAGWLLALGALVALGLAAREYRSLYITERLTSLQMVPAVSATELPPDWADGRTRVLMIGDSRIQDWKTPPSDARMILAASGIGGESTGQLERRFIRDALDVTPRPDVIVIAAGVNDLVAASLAENYTEAVREEVMTEIAARLVGMAAAARAQGIEPVIATIIQAAPPDRLRRLLIWDASLPALIAETNRRIRDAATAEGFAVIDFNAALEGGDGPLPARFARDTLHFTDAAYEALGAHVLDELAPQ